LQMILSLGPGLFGHDDEPEQTVAHRFFEFAMTTLNRDMEPSFERWLPLFDQERREIEQQGQTHEQYAAYTEYAAELEQHMSRFAEEEGYNPGDGGNFLAALQDAIQTDKARAERQVEVFLQSLRDQRRQMLGDDAPLDEEEEEAMQMMKTLFKPQTVDDMITMLLHMTEYTAFSNLMRAKVQQKKFIAEMERKKRELLYGEMGLAHRFIQFAMKLLNDNMHDFYKRSMPIFEQEAENLQNQGNTHEQYAVFQEYISVIESHLQQFMIEEGFGPDGSQALFDELQRLVQKDQEHVNNELRRIVGEVEAKKEQMRASQPEGQTGEPMILICKPTALGDLINSLVQQTEYQTFSATMRFRIEQERMLRMLMGDSGPAAPKPPLGDLEVVDLEFDESRATARPALGTLSVAVPEGFGPGDQLTVTTPDGQEMQVTVPGGLSPGMAFDVSYRPIDPTTVSAAAVPAPATGGYGTGGYPSGGAGAAAGYGTGGYGPT